MADHQAAVAEPEITEPQVARPKYASEQKQETKKQPRYSVLLWDDADHSYDYVVLMMKSLFRHPIETGFQIAKEVDASGKAVCLTTTLEHAELKRDQIHAFGKDELIARCKGSMSATIEPVNE
ncbi:ATP-dependent Clp protease adaptor ClpS [Novipirellula artificiosorum]|uniref:ATP-dependent Clp protease adaptor protein ClpS n=1 Tax=Novipirellula artificiosorum TaxID=2528016 RepID=A0A5C6D7P0_9BACT|nr:ATP-dependent Clp protease adaptor ClpS [Novipirellula artificiosorum]TWU32952.1 ATP-dependent Clp protease adaptor protein ClpS [Novipirellula artificiosorum]